LLYFLVARAFQFIEARGQSAPVSGSSSSVLRYLDGDFDDIWCGEHKEGRRAYCHPDFFKPISSLVYNNNKDGTFTEVSQKAGLGKPGKGLGIAIADYDHDGRIDLFVSNDSMVYQTLKDIPADQILQIDEPTASATSKKP
jgi:FG-GAP-like repeat